MSQSTQAISDSSFQSEVLDSSVPVVVDFWAPWCGPCRLLGPVLEQVAESLKGQAKVVKLNVDDNSETAGRFNVMNIPTIIYFKGGKEADRSVGVLPKEEIEKRVRRLL